MGNSNGSSSGIYASQEEKKAWTNISRWINNLEDDIAKLYQQNDIQTLLNGTNLQQQQAICSIYGIFEESFSKWSWKDLNNGKKSLFNKTKNRYVGRKLGDLTSTIQNENESLNISTRKAICFDIIQFVVEKVKFLEQIKKEYALGKEGCILTRSEYIDYKSVTESSSYGLLANTSNNRIDFVSYQEYYDIYKIIEAQNTERKKTNKLYNENKLEHKSMHLLLTESDETKAKKHFNQILSIQKDWLDMLDKILKKLQNNPELTMEELNKFKVEFETKKNQQMKQCDEALAGLSTLKDVKFQDQNFVKNGQPINEFHFV